MYWFQLTFMDSSSIAGRSALKVWQMVMIVERAMLSPVSSKLMLTA